jgi:hypothetical protein
MPNWNALERAVDGLVGRMYAEQVRLAFLKGGRTDPDRDSVDIPAVLHVLGDNASMRLAPGNEFKTRVAADDAELVIDRSRYCGPLPVKGDKVRATDRAGAPWFEVVTVSDRYSNLLVLTLAQA